MDELEREDFTRLKKVQANKAQAIKLEELTKALLIKEEAAVAVAEGGNSTNVLSGFDAADDEDVVFK